MPNFNDILEFIDQKKVERAAQRVGQLKAQVQVGNHATQVLNHPSWQVYVDHITTMLDKAKGDKAALMKDLAEGDDLGDKLGAMKLQLKHLDGLITGYTHAIDLIPELLRRAQDASAELQRPA